MRWREKLALVMGAAAPFVVGKDAVAEDANVLRSPDTADGSAVHKDLLVFMDPAQRERLVLLAGHSSHASHASHGSGTSGHSSHYSGTTYSTPAYSPPAPVYSPPAPIVTPPKPKPIKKRLLPLFSTSKTSGSTPVTTDGSSAAGGYDGPEATEEPVAPNKKFTGDELATVIQKLQVALIVRGYDPGPADGIFSTKTKAALAAFQAANNLTATGMMDLQSLRLLNVVQ